MQGFVIEAQPTHGARREGLDEHVRRRKQLPEDDDAVGLLQIENDRPAAAVIDGGGHPEAGR